MDDPVFPDKSCPPTDADLAAVLGRTKRLWDTLEARALDANPTATADWKYHMKKTGWTYILKGKRRGLLGMRPIGKGRFAVGFIFGEEAVRAAEQSDLPAQVVDAIRQSPKYPDGRVARFEVATAADLKIARELLAIKVANGSRGADHSQTFISARPRGPGEPEFGLEASG